MTSHFIDFERAEYKPCNHKCIMVTFFGKFYQQFLNLKKCALKWKNSNFYLHFRILKFKQNKLNKLTKIMK